MGQPSQNGPLTVQHFRSLLLDIMKAPFVVPTSIVTPSWFIAVALRLLDHALSYVWPSFASEAPVPAPPSAPGRFSLDSSRETPPGELAPPRVNFRVRFIQVGC